MSYEFPNDSAEGMDEAAVRILTRNMAAGRGEKALLDRAKNDLQRFNETGELPPAWEPEPTEAPEIDDAALDEAMREREAIESGCVDADDPSHPGHPVTCRRPCCRPIGWEP